MPEVESDGIANEEEEEDDGEDCGHAGDTPVAEDVECAGAPSNSQCQQCHAQHDLEPQLIDRFGDPWAFVSDELEDPIFRQAEMEGVLEVGADDEVEQHLDHDDEAEDASGGLGGANWEVLREALQHAQQEA